MTADRLAERVADVCVPISGGLVAIWNLATDGRLNNLAGLLVALVTVLVLAQRVALNCRRWHRTNESSSNDGD